MSTSDSQGRKPRLTKKQFIIGIAAICGIALIIEAVLLVRMLTKQQEKVNGEENTPTPTESVVTEKKIDSFIRKEYVTSGNNDRQIKSIKQEDYDSKGRLVYTYDYEVIQHLIGISPSEQENTQEVFYFYDEQERLIREDRVSKEYYPKSSFTREKKSTVSYEYKDGAAPVILIWTVDGNGETENSITEKYSENGILIEKIEYKYEKGSVSEKSETIYDEGGKVVSVVSCRMENDGRTTGTWKKEYSYYDSGIRKALLTQEYGENGLMDSWTEYEYNEYGVEISHIQYLNGMKINYRIYSEGERKTTDLKSSESEEMYFDETGRIIRRKSWAFREIIEEDFFYSDKTGKTAVIKTEKRTNDEGKIQTSKNTYDSEGRILQSVTKNRTGRETRIEYNWDYQDDGIRSKDVLQKTVYEDDILTGESLYLITPLAAAEQQEWYLSYGDFIYCLHDYHSDESKTALSLKSFSSDYVSPAGQYHLEQYYHREYDVKKETWRTCEEADFYSFGGLKTIRNLKQYLVTWDFDDRGNVIRVEWISDGETNQLGSLYEYEYTYYTASSEAGGQ